MLAKLLAAVAVVKWKGQVAAAVAKQKERDLFRKICVVSC
jgi:hypothetical protein